MSWHSRDLCVSLLIRLVATCSMSAINFIDKNSERGCPGCLRNTSAVGCWMKPQCSTKGRERWKWPTDLPTTYWPMTYRNSCQVWNNPNLIHACIAPFLPSCMKWPSQHRSELQTHHSAISHTQKIVIISWLSQFLFFVHRVNLSCCFSCFCNNFLLCDTTFWLCSQCVINWWTMVHNCRKLWNDGLVILFCVGLVTSCKGCATETIDVGHFEFWWANDPRWVTWSPSGSLWQVSGLVGQQVSGSLCTSPFARSGVRKLALHWWNCLKIKFSTKTHFCSFDH